MIKINLLGEDTSVDYTRQIAFGAYLGSVGLSLLLCISGAIWLGGQVDELEHDKGVKEAELKRVQAVTQEVKDIEKKQKSLEERLVHIATLKRNKRGPVRVLDSLNTAIPERAWLVEARERSGEFRLNGFALDGETISTFMRELEKSDYFPKVELDVARAATKQGVKIQEFVIKARVSYAGKIVPVEDKSSKGKDAKATKEPAAH